jgi:hypothetical protein
MHRIDAPGFAPGNLFTEGDPLLGIPPTQVSDDWLNDVQENLAVAIEGSGLTLSKGNGGQLLEAIRSLYGSGGRRNKVINGSMALNQRGGSHVFTNGTARYTLDRWRFDPTSGNTTSVTISQGGGGTPSFESGLRTSWNLTWNQSAALNGSGHPVLSQRIENCLLFAGKTVTLTIWAAKQGAAGGVETTLTPSLVQFKGTGPGTAGTVTGAPFTMSAGVVTRYSWTLAVPALASTALAADNYLELKFTGLKTATRGVVIYAVQLEAGNAATDFEDLPLQDIELLALRFYEKSYPTTVAPGTPGLSGMSADRASGTASYGLSTRFRVEKRATPTVTWYAPNTGTSGNITYGGAGGVDLSATPQDAGPSGTGYPSHSSQSADESWGHWTADAEL